jgi:hypothetical protein
VKVIEKLRIITCRFDCLPLLCYSLRRLSVMMYFGCTVDHYCFIDKEFMVLGINIASARSCNTWMATEGVRTWK